MQIYLLLTEKCNLKCKMCIRGVKSNSSLTLHDVLSAFQTDELCYYDIVITGGGAYYVR